MRLSRFGVVLVVAAVVAATAWPSQARQEAGSVADYGAPAHLQWGYGRGIRSGEVYIFSEANQPSMYNSQVLPYTVPPDHFLAITHAQFASKFGGLDSYASYCVLLNIVSLPDTQSDWRPAQPWILVPGQQLSAGFINNDFAEQAMTLDIEAWLVPYPGMTARDVPAAGWYLQQLLHPAMN